MQRVSCALLNVVAGLTTEQMLLKDMKAATGGDLNLAVSVVYMTLEVSLAGFTVGSEWPSPNVSPKPLSTGPLKDLDSGTASH